ncbi:hypothetical protein N803_16030 [Knoellia subterranea KCTC 19937]|uniref:Glycosyltransferase 2-like domain-containing protein n=1 Tax=Knoellia subterranea KCTC 19937 TaxID=1385521 RepID=A0A0A0JLJ6_9MICO|nr:hypothetical protein N803_16030 [Knoellia subterranea KCTC 19937]
MVPFYGVEDYFADCLESIRRQRLTDIEVILVDDGSPDGSRAIAEDFVARDSRFTLVTQENAGLGPARNTGTAQATGEYLTFVDSDDLVSAGGFEQMVGGLDRSGSSFAGGNARRFNNSSGIRQSWSHREAFAKTRIATHILSHPVLARDRMVWNKIYRRSFWDEFGYEFPAIRYEDYPVTFKAHLDALTVDLHSDAVYYWRERESGDSITQLAYRYDNLLDRVVSAEMVLDQADTSSPKVREQVYLALNESDFVTIAQAFASVPDDDIPALLQLGGRLADRLGDEFVGSGHPYTYIQYRALRAGDAPLLRELAEFRGGGGLQGRARGQRHPRQPWRVEYPYPGLGSDRIPRSLYAVPRTEIRLRTTIGAVEWEEGSLVLTGTAEIRHHVSGDDTSITMRVGKGSGSHPVPVTTDAAVDSHGDRTRVGFRAALDPDLLGRLQAAGTPVSPIEVTVRSGRLRRTGKLHGAAVGHPQWTPGHQVGDGVWAQPATTSQGHFVVSWLRQPWLLTSVEAHPGSARLTISGRGAIGSNPTLLVEGQKRRHEPDLVFPVGREDTDGAVVLAVSIPAAAVAGSVAGDDPFLHESVRGLKLDLDLGEDVAPELLLWQAAPHGVGVTHLDHLVRFTRSRGNRAALVESPLRVIAESARLDGDVLEVSGTNWTESRELHVGWRQYLPNSDDFIEEEGELEVDGASWRLRTPVTPLLETTADALDLQHSSEWVLFCSWDGQAATSVATEPFLLTTLPLTHDGGTRTGTLAPSGETLHFRASDRD